MTQATRRPVLLLGKTMTWQGLTFQRHLQRDYFYSVVTPFEWEVDASLDDEDEFEARLYFLGVKLVMGKGPTRPGALNRALQELSTLESKIGIETAARREGKRAIKNRTD